MGAMLAKAVGERGKARVVALLKAYLAFATVHGLLKTVRFVWFSLRARRALRDLPGYEMDWTGTDILRNFHRLHDWRRETMEKFPGADMVRTSGPGMEVACISEDSVRFVLKDEFDKFTKIAPKKLYLTQLLADFVGPKGIFVLRHGRQDPETSADNAMWHAQRKTASKIFTKNNFLNLMAKTFSAKADRAIQVVGKAADGADKIDAQRLFFSFTMDSIQKIFFSRDVDTLEGEKDAYAEAYDGTHHNMMAFLFNNVPVIIASTMFAPWPFGQIFEMNSTNLFLRAFRKMDRHGAAFEKHAAFLSERTFELVREARAEAHSASTREDLLALFLRMGDQLTDRELHDIILNFIIAGRDTTACLLTWFFFEMTQNLDVQDRLIEEIDRVLAGAEPSLESLAPECMPFLNGCLYEALRMHPPVPEDMKECNQDVVYKGVRIPKGTRVSFIPYTIGRNAERYPEPDRFNPDRWIPFKEPNMFEFPVFQAGPRFCLGKDMAKFEAKLLICKLLQNFRFTLLPGEAEKISYSMMITLSLVNNKEKTSNNLWLLPERRAPSAAQ